MMNYQIKKPDELTEHEIRYILNLWEASEWNLLNSSDFRNLFKDSEFHLLLDPENEILAVIRLNLDFTLDISGKPYSFGEVVGLVSAQEKKGYGSKLVQCFKENMIQRNIESIGFCAADLRPFYRRCNIEILENKGKAIKENTENGWITSEDDDILIFNISGDTKAVLMELGPGKNAYLTD
ncbi:GNAT family N-acetyltransferase [Chryseobacterium kwangjuense]|nr:GNAT family N-acetyltransferase [Chryseobacterium kwangjuense]